MNQQSFQLAILLIGIFFITSCSDSESITEKEVEEEILTDIYIPDTDFKVVGYLPYYRFSSIPFIEFEKMNYVNISFGNLESSGNLVVGDGSSIKSIVQNIKAKGPKVLLSIAGGALSAETKDNWVHYLSDAKRKETVKRMVRFVLTNNLDGIDVDIEGSLIPLLGSNYNKFVIELKKYLHAEGKAITAAMMPVSLNNAIHQNAIEAFDFINIMIYNATGSWDMSNPGQHSSYEFTEEALNFWENVKHIDSQKLVLGMPFYAFNFDPAVAASRTYGDIVQENVNYAYVDNFDQTFYNGIPTIAKKTALALNQVNGVMFWELGQDAFNELSLIKVVDQVLDIYPCSSGEVTLFYADEDGDGFGNPAKPILACEQPANYVDNRTDTDDTDTSIA